MGGGLASSGAYSRLEQDPEPLDEFSNVLSLYENLAGPCDLRDKAFPAEEGFFPSSKLLNLILARVVESHEVEVVDYYRLAWLQHVLVDRAETVYEKLSLTRGLDHDESLTEKALGEALPLRHGIAMSAPRSRI